jgi:methyltransferase family protein
VKDRTRDVLRRWKYRLGTALGRKRREDILRTLPLRSVGAEVGVFKGEFTVHILRIVRPVRLHLIDGWWTLYGERYPDWGSYTDFGRLGTREAHALVQKVVALHGGDARCEIHVEDDVACLQRLPDAHLDWAYLDSSHEYEHTMRELVVLVRKVRREGVILGDDWHDEETHGHHGVAKAVREFCAREGWTLTYRDGFSQWGIRPNS